MFKNNEHINPSNQSNARLTLIGAGPGDPELMTLKAVNALKLADVVLYDALVDKSLLQYARNAIHLFVGKRGGKQYLSQDDINQLIVQNALNHGHVVRLKGGDSFVFGRGHEEMECAQSFGITVEIVPGITSAISVPELQGIPVTKRGVSESFWVLTATNKKDELSSDIQLAVQSTATVIILMGTRKLDKIVALYQAAGKQQEHIAIIQNGSQKNEKIVIGTISTIVSQVNEQGIGSPAVIVIGDVVKYHPNEVGKYAAEAKMS